MPMTPEQYVQHKGLHCPYCNSRVFVGGPIEVRAGKASQEVTCTECGGAWLDEYQLVGFTPVEIPDGNATTAARNATPRAAPIDLKMWRTDVGPSLSELRQRR